MNRPSSGDWVRIVGIIYLAITALFLASLSVELDTVAASCACDDCRCCDACPGNRGGERE